jgi:superfamily II DNA or RNA helicase
LEKVVEEITGEKPVRVDSFTDADNKKLKNFQHDTSPSRAKWLISVMKVTEGVDIKHLRVCVYLTHKTAPLLWTQILGRILRKEEKLFGNQTSHFYQYDDGIDNVEDEEDKNLVEARSVRIREYSESITQQRDAVLKAAGKEGPPRICSFCNPESPNYVGPCPGKENPLCPKKTKQFASNGATGYQDDQIYDDQRVSVAILSFYKPLVSILKAPEVVCKTHLEELEKAAPGSTTQIREWLTKLQSTSV